VTHEEVTKQELGGAMTHNEKAASRILVPRDDADWLRHDSRKLIGLSPCE